MKKLTMFVLGAIGIAIFVCGCQDTTPYVQYPTTIFAEVPLKAHATVKVVPIGVSPVSDRMLNALRDAFARDQQFTVVDKDADYWMIVNGLDASRIDTPAEISFNDQAEKVAAPGSAPDGTPGDGHEIIVMKKQASETQCKVVSIAIYEAGTLTPVHYIEIPVYDGDIKGLDEKLEDPDSIEKRLSMQIVDRMKGVFLTQKKIVETPISCKTSSAMKSAIGSKDAAKAVASAMNGVQSWDAFLKDVQSGKYEGKKDELQVKLSDYYVQAIAREIDCLDAKVLKDLHAQHIAILQYSTDECLAKACPIALARLEYKLAHLGSK